MVAQHGARTYGGRPIADLDSERRSRLLDAALDVFSAKGYSDTTVLDICKRAHLSTRQFYNYFDSRTAVLTELYERVNDEARAAVLDAVTAAEGGFADRLRAAGRAYAAVMTSDPRVTHLAVSSVIGVSTEFEARRATERDRWVYVLNTLAAGAVAAGEIPARDYSLAWTALIGSIESMGALLVRTSGAPRIDDIFHELDHIIEGLLAPPEMWTADHARAH